MKLKIDLDICQGHGRCYDLAPKVFREDARGYVELIHETGPPELEEEARKGKDNCPELAIDFVN